MANLPAPILAEYLRDPRLLMAQQAQQAGASTAPVATPLAGLARMLTGVVGGYNQRKVQDEYKQQADTYRQSLASALKAAQSGDRAGAMDLLAGSPYLGENVLQAQLAEALAKPPERKRRLTEEEELAEGLDPSGVYEMSPDGGITTVQKPRENSAFQQKLQDLQSFGVDPNSPQGQQYLGMLPPTRQRNTVTVNGAVIDADTGNVIYKDPTGMASDESFGQPVTEMGPDGTPIVVRYGNRGTRSVVEGAVPAPKDTGEKQKRQIYQGAIADAASKYASAVTGTPIEQVRAMTAEQVRDLVITESRFLSGPIAGRIPLTQFDTSAYAQQAAGALARMNNPTGTVTNADFEVAAKAIFGPEKPPEVNAQLIYDALVGAGWSQSQQPSVDGFRIIGVE